MLRTAIVSVVIAALLVGCRGETPAPTGDISTSVVGSGVASDGGLAAMGPGLAVGEALDSGLIGPLLVRGFVIVSGGTVRLCEALAESHPPQCAGRSLSVLGLDDATLAGLTTAEGTRWSDDERMLLGEVVDGTLRLNAGASG